MENAKSKEYTFKLFPTKTKSFSRSHWCDNDTTAKHELTGMMYALYFLYTNPRAELWCGNQLIHSMC